MGNSVKYLKETLLISAVSFYCLQSCATDSSSAFKVEFDQDVSVVFADDKKVDVKRGESIDLPNEPLTVTRSSHKSMLLVPIPADPGTLKLRLIKEEALASGGVASAGVSQDTNKIIQSIVEIQSLIAEERADDALMRVQALRQQYSDLSYLRFIEASCFLLKNDIAQAKALTEQALQDFPDDQSGKALLAALKSMGSSQTSKDDKKAH